MNIYDPANLSPLPKEPLACELPFGLTWDDLGPVLPGFNEQERGRAQAYASYEKQGLNGGDNSLILRLSYPIKDHQTGMETVFVKYNPDPQKAEAQKCRYIAARGVATPRLLGAFQKGGAEIILLEFLPAIGIDFHSASEVEGFLHLAAQLNSIHDPPKLFAPPPGLPQAEFDGYVRGALAELAQGEVLPPVDTSRWFAAYQVAQEAVQAMPLALNHNEFYFQQVGWAQRGPVRQLVIFDLETMVLAPRFTDIADVLYPLAIYSGRDQVELFQIYLERLRQFGHFEIGFEEALRELRTTRVVVTCYSLPWLLAEAKDSSAVDRREDLSLMVACLGDDLTSLGLV